MKRLIAISTACLLAFTACGGKTDLSVDNSQSENLATIYSYDGTEAIGGLWVLGYQLMEKYAEDMTNSTYTLSSDWLASKDETNRAYGFRLIPMTETMLKNSISRMIKSFYSGENESALKQYNYVFSLNNRLINCIKKKSTP